MRSTALDTASVPRLQRWSLLVLSALVAEGIGRWLYGHGLPFWALLACLCWVHAGLTHVPWSEPRWVGVMRGLALVLGPLAAAWEPGERPRQTAVLYAGLGTWCCLLVGLQTLPAPHASPALMNGFLQVAVGSLIFASIRVFLLMSAEGAHASDEDDPLMRFGMRVFVYTVALAGVYRALPWVDEALADMNKHPEAWLMGFVIVFVMWALGRWTQWWIPAPTHQALLAERGAARKGYSLTSTPEAYRRTAVHECGHALLLACWPEQPEHLELVIHKTPQSVGPMMLALGWISYDRDPHRFKSDHGCAWEMLILLGGMTAEGLVLGTRGPGAKQDLLQWQRLARGFLESGWGGVYYLDVRSLAERKHNQAAMELLFKQQQALVLEYLTANRALLETLVEAVLAKGRLDRNELMALWVGARSVPHLPPTVRDEPSTVLVPTES